MQNPMLRTAGKQHRGPVAINGITTGAYLVGSRQPGARGIGCRGMLILRYAHIDHHHHQAQGPE